MEGLNACGDAVIDLANPVFFVGDHLGFDPPTRARLAELGAIPIALGPIGLQADDAIVVASNELDRRAQRDPPSTTLPPPRG